MRLTVFICFLVLSVCAFPNQTYAHALGLLPFFTINGTLAITSPLQTVRVVKSGFDSAQDTAHKAFTVGEPITFAIDTQKLQTAYPEELFKKMRYNWDFGDNIKGSGTTNVHSYQQPGSYILSVKAFVDEQQVNQEPIESVVVDIVPDRAYKRPQAIIKINGEKLADPLKDSYTFDHSQELTFDASESVAPSSKIVEYLWDFGDGSTRTGAVVRYTYKEKLAYVSPTLRIKDENNVLAYAFADIVTFGAPQPTKANVANAVTLKSGAIFPVTICLFVLAMLPLVMLSKKRKK